MNRKSIEALAVRAAITLPVLVPASVEAGCNCGAHGPAMAPVPMVEPFPAYGSLPGPMVGLPSGPMAAPRPVAPPRRDWFVPAPPGTLGRTYQLCSRPLPEDEHPRNAGLEIKVSGATEIYVDRMEGFVDEDGFWQFTTEKPLIPGQPAIVRVVITRPHSGKLTKDVRVVRLIPGRVLSVEF